MTPANGAAGVDPSIGELAVRFNVPMSKNICLMADCTEGKK